MPQDITKINVAIVWGQYLNITLPDVLVKKVKEVFEHHYNKHSDTVDTELSESCAKEEEELEAKLTAQGIDTPEKRDALVIADDVNATFSRAVRLYGRFGTLDLSYERFDAWLLEEALKKAISDLEKHYNPINMPLSTSIVNPDFKDKAKKWLLGEVYQQLGTEPFNLLGEVSVEKHSEGIVQLKEIPRERMYGTINRKKQK